MVRREKNEKVNRTENLGYIYSIILVVCLLFMFGFCIEFLLLLFFWVIVELRFSFFLLLEWRICLKLS